MKDEKKNIAKCIAVLLALLVILFLTVPRLISAWNVYAGYEDTSGVFYSSEFVEITNFGLLVSICVILIFMLAYCFLRDMQGEGRELKIRK